MPKDIEKWKLIFKDRFIEKANKIHNFKYDYSLVEYIDASTKVIIICPFHGKFEQTPSNHTHVKKYGCFTCGVKKNIDRVTLDQDEIKNRLIALNLGDHYDFNLVDYKHWNKPVLFICKYHGIFEKRVSCFINGTRCNKCKIKFNGLYNEKFFIRYPDKKNDNGFLYFIELELNRKKYLKIGITINGNLLSTRYRKYNFKMINLEPMPLYNCFKVERKILEQYKSKRTCKFKIQGRTECLEFSKILKNEILGIIKHGKKEITI